MKKILYAAAVLCAISCTNGMSKYDNNAPVGWANCTSIAGGSFNLNGGGSGSGRVTLFSDGNDCRDALEQAVNENDIIILDGSKGDFVLSEVIIFTGISNKTIVGVNGATLRTAFNLTDELKDMIEKNVPHDLSSGDGTGGILSNGIVVGEARELATRQALIDYTNDNSEKYNRAGFMYFHNGCDNIIIRNLAFIGPGAMDIGGTHLMEIAGGCTHFWIDHCSFCDAQRTSMYIGAQCDCIDVTWCSFDYTDKSYNHCYSNLVGGDDMPDYYGVDKLNVTFAFCQWTRNVEARMPMVRFGNVHVLNCYFDEGVDGPNPRMESELRIEGCYFDKGCKGMSRYDAGGKSVPKAYQFVDNYSVDGIIPEDKGSVSMPYDYKMVNAAALKEIIPVYAGPTLKKPLRIGR